MTIKLSNEDKAGLTPEEIAELEGADPDQEAAAAREAAEKLEAEADKLVEDAKKDKPDDQKKDGGKADDDAAKAKEEADRKAAEEAAAAAAAEADKGKKDDAKPDTVEAEPLRARPVPRWEAPADADAKLKDIAERKKALAAKFNDGDIDATEHLTELDRLLDEERPIREAIMKADMALDMRKADWFEATVPSFLDQHQSYRDNETLAGMLDAEVRRRQTAAIKDGKTPFDPKILDDAHTAITESVAALIGGGTTTKKADDKKGEGDGGGKDALKVQKRDEPPLTLGKIPAASATDLGGETTFDRLDELADKDPLLFETALARLPEDQKHRYLAKQ